MNLKPEIGQIKEAVCYMTEVKERGAKGYKILGETDEKKVR